MDNIKKLQVTITHTILKAHKIVTPKDATHYLGDPCDDLVILKMSGGYCWEYINPYTQFNPPKTIAPPRYPDNKDWYRYGTHLPEQAKPLPKEGN